MKLLIVEDDSSLALNLKKILVKAGFAVDTASTLETASVKMEVNEYDCLVLDLNLPDGSGFSFLSQLRENAGQTPVIVMTARGEVEDKVKGLNLGADDYVAKPIDGSELTARIRAVIRRGSQSALPIITVGNLVVKPAQQQALLGKQELELTAKEFAILEYLALHSGQVLTRTMLMEHIWGDDFDTFSNVIDVYIRNLRRKIETYSQQKLIKTIRGKGYVLSSKN